MKFYGVTIQLKATEQFFRVVLLYNSDLPFESVNPILQWDYAIKIKLLHQYSLFFPQGTKLLSILHFKIYYFSWVLN